MLRVLVMALAGTLLVGCAECEIDTDCESGRVCKGKECVARPGAPAGSSTCGNDVIEGGEQCDDGNTTVEACTYGDETCSVCGPVCTQVAGMASYCGDGAVDDVNEPCDDGSAQTSDCLYGLQACDVCTATCTLTPGQTSYCGDGVIDTDAGESCEGGDPCTGFCTGILETPVCNDGVVQFLEECDGATDTVPCDYDRSCIRCDSGCLTVDGSGPYCGDGVVDTADGEACDDGELGSIACEGTGCQGCDDDCQWVTGEPIVEPPMHIGSGLVDAAVGATIMTSNVAGEIVTLNIPPGGLHESTTISLTLLDQPPTTPYANSAFGGFELQPDGLALRYPATVTLLLDDSEPVESMSRWLVWADSANQGIAVGVGDTLVFGELHHFSEFDVVDPTPEEAQAQANAAANAAYDPMDADRVRELIDFLELIGTFCENFSACDELEIYGQADTLLREAVAAFLALPVPAEPCGEYWEVLQAYIDMAESHITEFETLDLWDRVKVIAGPCNFVVERWNVRIVSSDYELASLYSFRFFQVSGAGDLDAYWSTDQWGYRWLRLDGELQFHLKWEDTAAPFWLASSVEGYCPAHQGEPVDFTLPVTGTISEDRVMQLEIDANPAAPIQYDVQCYDCISGTCVENRELDVSGQPMYSGHTGRQTVRPPLEGTRRWVPYFMSGIVGVRARLTLEQTFTLDDLGHHGP